MYFIYVSRGKICIYILFLSKIIDVTHTELYTLPQFLQNLVTKNRTYQHRDICYGEIGCLEYSPEWYHPLYRPVNLMPSKRNDISTVFIKWILQNSKLTSEVLGYQLDPVYCNSSLVILIHDFTSNGYDNWIRYLSNVLLLRGAESMSTECIVSVQWALGAEPPFQQAVANARVVALEVNYFLDKITGFSSDRAEIKTHIIGHGLGAHIAGYVGKLGKVDVITALDPTGPYFMKMPMNVRLHKLDAKFVEVVHTDNYPTGQGYPFQLGHIDYYPNGGKQQPGCKDVNHILTDIDRNKLTLGRSLSACSHKRSQKYYIEALIHPSCSILGMACSSYKDFLQGQCLSCGRHSQYCSRLSSTNLTRIQKDTAQSSGFFFVTASSAPFCVEVIKVLIIMKPRPKLQAVLSSGYFIITVRQSPEDVTFLLNENHYFNTMMSYSQNLYLVFRTVPPPLLMPIHDIGMKWVPFKLSANFVDPPDVTVFVIEKITDGAQSSPQFFCTSANTIENKSTRMSLRRCDAMEQDNIQVDFF